MLQVSARGKRVEISGDVETLSLIKPERLIIWQKQGSTYDEVLAIVRNKLSDDPKAEIILSADFRQSTEYTIQLDFKARTNAKLGKFGVDRDRRLISLQIQIFQSNQSIFSDLIDAYIIEAQPLITFGSQKAYFSVYFTEERFIVNEESNQIIRIDYLLLFALEDILRAAQLFPFEIKALP